VSPRITLIAALDKEGVIGREGRLPWRLPADLAHFRRETLGKPVVMGRKTHESIGRALDGRHNIVLSRAQGYEAFGCTVVNSVDDALGAVADAEEVMVIGGASVYESFFSVADRLLLTRVLASVGGDVLFPRFDGAEWELLERRPRSADSNNPHGLEFLVYQRRQHA
jgi:dihydrofolate reductase